MKEGCLFFILRQQTQVFFDWIVLMDLIVLRRSIFSAQKTKKNSMAEKEMKINK